MQISSAAYASLVLEYDGGQHEYTGNLYTLSVNGKKVSTPLEPIIFNDRALVPVREVFEATGARVDYIASEREVFIEGDNIEISMNIGSARVFVNGKRNSFPDGVVPKLIAKKGESAKTMVPVRFISESLGYVVNFDGKSIDIITKENTNTSGGGAREDIKATTTLSSEYCKQSGDYVMISVKADAPIDNTPKLTLTDSGVLYFDVFGAKSKLPSSVGVERGAVTKVRVGNHDEYVRIALDVKDLVNYSVKLSSDKQTIMVTTQKKAENKTENEKIVVIDAGHGGSDGGAGIDRDGEYIKEKDITLSVAKKTADILKSNSVRVEMTRTGDTYPSLTDRSTLANSINAAIFVSIHVNSATNSTANGVEVYYASENNSADYGVRSSELAEKILNGVITYTNANNRKVKTERHVVTRTSNMPATLVEIGFLTNEEELAKLLSGDYQYKIASGIAEGIMKCLPKITLPEKGAGVVLGENDLGNKIA